MKTIHDLKEELEKSNSELYKNCRLFFAFSKEQFEKNKTELQENEKYVSFGGGGFLPNTQIENLISGLEQNRDIYNQKVKQNNLRVREIAYEFSNHECFYTGNWTIVADMFDHIKPEVIHRIYRIEYKKHLEWCEQTGN